jgi:hypothetical protein
MNDKVQIHKSICANLNRLYAEKNHDYGDSFAKIRQEFGDKVILIRLSDKLERLKTLLGKEDAGETPESVDDTLMDMANYCILELIERYCGTKKYH